jgi:CheY-like chemotaxis protein
MANKQNINELIALIEHNKVVTGNASWYKSGSASAENEGENGEDETADNDFSDVHLLIFAADGPFSQSLLPMLDQHALTYAVTDVQDEAIDIVINHPNIRHVLIDMDKPTNPALGINIFSDLKTINPHILIYYCTKNPMSMESRTIQAKGAKLIQKPVLRKTLDHFVEENFGKGI